MSPAKPSMAPARVQPNSKAWARQLYAWSIHPDELKPLATDEPNKCQHGKARSFSLTLGDKYPECSGNLVVYVPDCCKCERKLDTLTQPNPEQREAFRSKLKAYDEAAKTPKSTLPSVSLSWNLALNRRC
ncbi:hypothetical protein MVEN_02571800 [Mycena venus]|uniref:Uncharacterized protein n=1 Tax=Mycena venus TaxID=2733690 RepID=A0A8H6TZ47_9AGAR|nr:hypothetical protein MVEN_02571800 [Mycena venus]